MEKKRKFLKKIAKFFFEFLAYNTPGRLPKNFSPIGGAAVWPAIRNIHMNILFLFYYIEDNLNLCAVRK